MSAARSCWFSACSRSISSRYCLTVSLHRSFSARRLSRSASNASVRSMDWVATSFHGISGSSLWLLDLSPIRLLRASILGDGWMAEHQQEQAGNGQDRHGQVDGETVAQALLFVSPLLVWAGGTLGAHGGPPEGSACTRAGLLQPAPLARGGRSINQSVGVDPLQ